MEYLNLVVFLLESFQRQCCTVFAHSWVIVVCRYTLGSVFQFPHQVRPSVHYLYQQMLDSLLTLVIATSLLLQVLFSLAQVHQSYFTDDLWSTEWLAGHFLLVLLPFISLTFSNHFSSRDFDDPTLLCSKFQPHYRSCTLRFVVLFQATFSWDHGLEACPWART